MIFWKEYDFSQCKETDVYTFDTEVSSYWVKESGEVIEYSADIPSEVYNEELCAGAVVYIWMIGINDTVIYGRELDDLPEVLKLIHQNFNNLAYIYVHNLAYDFQFLRNVLIIEDVFARQLRKPMKFSANGFQWRCSYMLTRLSLDAWAKSLNIKGIEKKTGQLDYITLRSPLTPLNASEKEYCKYDILVMYHGIQKFIAKYGSIEKIPLTQTGEVRKVVSDMYKKDNGHRWKITNLQPKTVEEYKRLKSVFAGGDTHANRKNACKTHRNVASFDKTSDYPYQMCAERYPSTKFVKVSTNLKKIDPENYAYIIMVRLHGVTSKISSTYIPRSHCVAVTKGTYDNGRIINAECIAMAMTEQDKWIIEQCYNIERWEVISIYRSRKQYLNKKYIEYILELYRYKTSLKGDPEAADLYAQSKQFINSLFGMMVTDILMPDIKYENNTWIHPERLTPEVIQNKLNAIQEKWYKNNMAYQFGVWVTAYARRELWEAIINCGDDECYHDTDSVKFIHYEKYVQWFKNKDSVMDEKLRKMCEYHNIDFEKTRPLKPNGKPAPLGHWDFEGVYRQARFEGAKRYCYNYKNSDIHITVAGVPKTAAAQLHNINQFKDGFIFNRETCGKKLLTYLDGCNACVILPDGYEVKHSYAINMRNNGYTMGLTEEYNTLIREIDAHKGIIKYGIA